MAWSLAATRYHDGIVLQAGTAEGSARTAVSSGRWVAGVGSEGGDEDERLDVGVAGGGIRDHRPAVGVADEDDRAGDRRQHARQVGGVARDAAQRVGQGDHRVTLVLQPLGDRSPARGVGPGAVDEDDGRFRRGAFNVGAAGGAGHAEGHHDDERHHGRRSADKLLGGHGVSPCRTAERPTVAGHPTLS
jgi:hypothetical protein